MTTIEDPRIEGPSDLPQSAGRIVVGVDGSHPSVGALKWAVEQAELTGSTLEIVIAWDWPGTYGWNVPLSFEYDPAAVARSRVENLAIDSQRNHPKVRVATRVEHGYPAPVLVEASRGADMLVVGSRGHGELAGMLLGSVSQYCATKAHCPVMIYR
jgi:nucleotide-binding universal stress UspA family protein